MMEYDVGRYGNGGPVSVAMRGQWIVTGYSNGTIARAQLLAPEFKLPDDSSLSANHLSSTSDLPPDEWDNPMLGFPNDSEEEEYSL